MRVPATTGSGLSGPARTRHQPRTIAVLISELPGNQLRISTPHARGWAAVARNQPELARAIAQAFTETAVASYANWRGQLYDLDKLTHRDDPTEPPRRRTRPSVTTGRRSSSAQVGYGRDAVVRPDQASPDSWRPHESGDGSWVSPAGRRYTDQKVISRLLERRARLNQPLGVQGRKAS